MAGRTRGSKNKRTLVREAAFRAKRAAAAAAAAADGDLAILADSMRVMEEAMTFILQVAQDDRKNKSTELAITHYLQAAGVAEKIAQYKYPRLSAVKVAGDAQNPLLVDGMTPTDILVQLIARIVETGILPTGVMKTIGQPEADE